MIKRGWIVLDRSIQEGWLWDNKPFSKGQAWIDMLLSANYKDNKYLIGNEVVEIKRGSFVTSEKKLMERWGWGNTKLRNFLNILKTNGMIKQSATKKQSVITIVNYSDYQDLQSDDKSQTNRKQSDDKVLTNTNNNSNNILYDKLYNNKERKKIIKERKKTTTYDEILSAVEEDSLRDLYYEYIKMRNLIKSPMTDRALTMLINKVNNLEPTNIEQKKKLLETAILNNWKSVYTPKDNDKQQEPQKYGGTYL